MHLVDDPERTAAEQAWFDGGSALPLVTLLASRGELDEAAAVARLALTRPECQDAEAIEGILESTSRPPDDWKEKLDEFADDPSLDRWKGLMQFVPDDLLYQRLRNSIRYLIKRGVDGDILFLCAAHPGLTPDAIELVELGRVSVQTILDRSEGTGGARATYLGLAAQAAYLAGDFLGTIRLLRESMASESEWCSAFPHIAFIRERATSAEHAALDRAGIPPWPAEP